MAKNWADKTPEQKEEHRRKQREKRANRTPEEREANREYLKRYAKRVQFRDEVQAAIHSWPQPTNTQIMERFHITYEELQRIKANRTLPDTEPIMGFKYDSRRTG